MSAERQPRLVIQVLDSSVAVLLHGLSIQWPIFVAQAVGAIASFGATVALG